MDTLSVHEIVRGIVDESMKAERLALLQLLSNKVGESTEPLTAAEAAEVFTIALTKLSADTDSVLIEIMLSLLTNSTISDQNTKSFVNFLNTSEKYNAQFSGALNTFLDHNPQIENDADEDSWCHMGSVLCNLCQIDEGRTLILRQSLGYMPRIIAQVTD